MAHAGAWPRLYAFSYANMHLREFDPNWNAIAKSWTTVPAAERDNHFFATVDFDNAMTIFQQVCISLYATQTIGAHVFVAGPAICTGRSSVARRGRSSPPGKREDEPHCSRLLPVSALPPDQYSSR